MGKNIVIAILSILLFVFMAQNTTSVEEIQRLEEEVQFLGDGSYEDGYFYGTKDGYEYGLSEGLDTGYQNGIDDGYSDGQADGYYEGLADGAEMFCDYLAKESGVVGPLEEYILSLQDYFDGEAPLSEAEEAFRELTDFCLKYDWAENCCSMGDVDFLYPDDQ